MNENRGLYYFSGTLFLLTWFLVVAGALVTSTGSGLSVPDWPLSFGQVFPPMVGGVFFEHGHRMIATLVGFLTIVLCAWIAKSSAPRWIFYSALGALGLVIVQGIFGGLTVLLRLPTWTSTTHAVMAQTFLAWIALITLFLSPFWQQAKVDANAPTLNPLKKRYIVLIVLLYGQLILGGLIRHGGGVGALHLHATNGVIIVGVIGYLFVWTRKHFAFVPKAVQLVTALKVLAVAQLILGVMAFLPMLGIISPALVSSRIAITVAHLAIAALILTLSVIGYAAARHMETNKLAQQ